MNTKLILSFVLLLAGGLLISACGGQATPASTQGSTTELPAVISSANIVVEGRVVPNESAELSFFTNGQVAEVLVEEGATVKKGDVLARLGNREEVEAAIANAEAELLAAQQALEELNSDVSVTRAEALRAVAAANRAVKDAQYQLDNFEVLGNQENMTAMQGVEVTKQALDQARDAFEPYKYRPSGDATRKKLKETLDTAQSDYNSAIRRLEYETDLQEAEANLERAMKDYEDLKDGPDPDLVASAESRVAATKAALKSAHAALDKLELVATIDGTLVKQDLIVGQQVAAGQPVMQIADFSRMYVETDDLTEIEVVDVSVGQKVTVIPDALPDLEVTGNIESISSVFEEKRGDITYTARILLDEVDPRLRWGMTVVVTLE
ncbi:MAG: efflux RND transporter periplasmic adaptor subunit [Anaerolineales bacterium]|nr:efflux RND transporter periplasmic adaptor subunit [Anaerolineales bacterium]